MKLSNKWNLPETLVRATAKRNDMYDRGAAHRSATQLVNAPRIDALRRVHYAKMEKDVADEFWALFGSAVHYILELGIESHQISEERLFCEVDGWTISGALDCQTRMHDGSIDITDYKVISTYTLMKDGDGTKPEWEQQLNIQAHLVEESKGIPVTSLNICAIVRDWQRSKAQVDPLYPPAPVVMVPIPLWSKEEREFYLKSRVQAHREAEMLIELGLPLPECSAHDRWEIGTKWAVKKKGGKRAVRTLPSLEEAEAILSTMPDHIIEHRPGRSARCEGNFCGVADWCDQFAAVKKAKQEQPDEA